MEFFDKKEEVIDIELTQYGRHLMSKGKFKPQYYSFFDDNVLYNIERAGLTEKQNSAEERIKETPSLKPQISISPLEKKFANQYDKIYTPGEDETTDITFQSTPEKNYALPSPLGMSDVNSQYSPSWSVQYLNGALTGTVENLNLTEKSGGSNSVFVPQLNSDVIVRVYPPQDTSTPFVDDEFEQGPVLSEYQLLSSDEELYILLKVSENNGFFQKKNFDIEVFEISEEEQNGAIIETLKPLYFPKHNDPNTELDFITFVDPSLDQSYVDYYLDILVDDEVDKEIVCELDPEFDQTLGVFADPRTQQCQDIINQRKRKIFNIYEDEADEAGEIC